MAETLSRLPFFPMVGQSETSSVFHVSCVNVSSDNWLDFMAKGCSTIRFLEVYGSMLNHGIITYVNSGSTC